MKNYNTNPTLHFNFAEGIILLTTSTEVREIRLEYQLSLLLEKLVQQENQIVSRTELIEWVWAENPLVGKTALTKNIWRLRQFLKDHQLQDYLQIETIPKRGYRLIRLERSYPSLEKTPVVRAAFPSFASNRVAISVVVLAVLVFVIMSLASIGEDVIYL